MKVKITDKNHKYCGQEFEGSCFYYDYKHTGNSDDLYTISTPDGKETLTTSQIDEGHYNRQLLAIEAERLGAKIGDIVIITRTGSYCCNAGFDTKLPHKITDIDFTGHVEFDGGAAKCFRPDVELVNS